MRTSSEQIETYLTRYGWAFDTISSHQWLTGWQGRYKVYGLSISASLSMISMKVDRYWDPRIDWEERADLLRYVCDINAQTPMVKLGIEKDGTISLLLQLWGTDLSYKDFSQALGLIGYYADSLFEELTLKFRDQPRHGHHEQRLLT